MKDIVDQPRLTGGQLKLESAGKAESKTPPAGRGRLHGRQTPTTKKNIKQTRKRVSCRAWPETTTF